MLEVRRLKLSRVPSHHFSILVQQKFFIVERDSRDTVGVLQTPAQIPVDGANHNDKNNDDNDNDNDNDMITIIIMIRI